jgi:hypothetical protein
VSSSPSSFLSSLFPSFPELSLFFFGFFPSCSTHERGRDLKESSAAEEEAVGMWCDQWRIQNKMVGGAIKRETINDRKIGWASFARRAKKKFVA